MTEKAKVKQMTEARATRDGQPHQAEARRYAAEARRISRANRRRLRRMVLSA